MSRQNHIRWYSVSAGAMLVTQATCSLLLGVCLKVSNVFQLLAALLAAAFCLHTARSQPDKHLRSLWLLLGSAFALWSSAQGYFTAVLLVTGKVLPYPSVADALWLAVSLPILLIVVRQRSNQIRDWVSWLDMGQAALFFSLLGILVFNRRAGLLITQAYDVQGAALVLLCGMQFSRSEGKDRRFFRDLGIYLLTYAVLSSSDYRIEASGMLPGSIVDLCWTIPPLTFIMLCEWTAWRTELAPATRRPVNESLSLVNLHGTSALGLFLVSLVLGVFLHQREPLVGYIYTGVASLLFAVRMVGRESQIFEAHRALRDSYTRDPITGLPNRTSLMGMSSGWLEPGSWLLICNVDRFKLLNESFGRGFSDAVLKGLAQRIEKSSGVEQAFHIGGDEMLIIVSPEFHVEAQAQGEHLLAEVSAPLTVENRTISVSMTIGAAEFTSQEELTRTLLCADAAVSFGKGHGRNQFVLFSETMLRDAARELAFETALKNAIQKGLIRNHYQAIYCVRTCSIVGFEALARWEGAGQVIAPPDEFIKVAEDTWMILELGRQLITQACEDVAQLTLQAGRQLWVSVNLSGKQLFDQALIEHVRAEVRRVGIPMTSLKFEITESIFLHDFKRATDMLEELRSLGIKIALDDFGTGFSSLSYLASLPFDLLKIDRSFVQNLEIGTQRFAIVNSIVQLANTLGKEVVAEGVETEAEKNHLILMGCELLQGYLVSRPVSLLAAKLLVGDSKPNQLPSGSVLPARCDEALAFRSAAWQQIQPSAENVVSAASH